MKICPSCSQEYADEKLFCENDGSALRSTGTAGADLIGSIIEGKFHITRKLGEGGMGAVYLGEHVKMRRKSAIKVISRSMANDADAIARFNREAANASKITHPNVCGIYDFGETEDGLAYLAMEFIEGQALTDIIEAEGALSPARAAGILRQSAAALQAAHDLGIVHRDLKPDNIMIARDRDETDLVKVVDFGIAKAIGGDSDQKVTKTGLVVGTPEYMSPEQLSGDSVDGRSDIYSLALVFFRMLTGTLPFQADTAQEVMIKRLTDEPAKLKDALPSGQFPDALQAAMDKALQRMPGDRYQNAFEFGREVEAAAAGLSDEAPSIASQGATQMVAAAAAADSPTADLPGTRFSAASDGSAATAAVKAVGAPHTPATGQIPPAVAGKRPVPMAVLASAIGVIAIGGSIGAAVMMSGGNEPPPNGSLDSSANGVTNRTDTTTGTSQIAAADSGSVTVGRRDSATQMGNQQRRTDPAITTDPVTDPGDTTPSGPDTGGSGIVVDLSGARGLLDDILIEIDPDPALSELSLPRDRPKLEAWQDTATAYYSDLSGRPSMANETALAALALAVIQGIWFEQARDGQDWYDRAETAAARANAGVQGIVGSYRSHFRGNQ